MSLIDEITGNGEHKELLTKIQIELAKQGEYTRKLINYVEELVTDVSNNTEIGKDLEKRIIEIQQEVEFIKGSLSKTNIEVNTNIKGTDGDVNASQEINKK